MVVIVAAILVILGVLALLGYMCRIQLAAWFLRLPKTGVAVVVECDVVIPMRDGIKLVADIYRPKKVGRYPAIVARTPYEKSDKDHLYPYFGKLFASQGYVCVVQDTRGKHHSEGDFYPFAYEDVDSCDTVDWVVEQEWSSGRVGMFGWSYLGLVEWLSAPQQSHHLRAIVPIFISQKAYDIVRGNHGVLYFIDVLAWHFRNAYRQARDDAEIDWLKVVQYLPVIRAEESVGEVIPGYKDWVQHSDKDGYWGQWRVDNKVSHIRAPALLIAGWFDRFLDSSIEDFQRMVTEGGSDEARKSHLIIGPWVHEPGKMFPSIKFGPAASPAYQIKEIVRWYDRWVKGLDNGVDREDPIRLFVMGINKWRTEKEWPLARTQHRKYYLHSQGYANTRSGDGWLNTSEPVEKEADHFDYNPAHPVLSIGGNTVYEKMNGPLDQIQVEIRKDVLVYTTAPLEKDLEVTGNIILCLYASSSAPDTDFTGKVCDVHPDGRSFYVKSGIVRARYRESLRKPLLMTPEEVIRFEINIGATSMVFLKKHRIRLQVSSSAFPEYSRNLNVEEDPHHAENMEVAHQTIYHDPEYPSYLLLPVIE